MDTCRVVLVEPRIAANIGAVARVMRNFGVEDLVLVAPEADRLSEEARKLSTQGEDILHAARIVGDFGEAVADCVMVAGTSARVGGPVRRQSVGTPREIMPSLVEVMATGPIALVFGREQSGLSDAEVTRCHCLIRIPAAPDYPALNLAQAVAICLYELCWASRARQAPPEPHVKIATFVAQEHMFHRLREALEAIHFVYGPKGEALMHALRHLLGRARLTDMEVDVLLGLARQIKWFAEQRD